MLLFYKSSRVFLNLEGNQTGSSAHKALNLNVSAPG